MAQYTVRCDGTDAIHSHARMSKALLDALDNSILEFAQFAVNEVKEHLRATIQRPNESDGTLESAITGAVDMWYTHTRIGVGDKAAMYKVAKYWRLINDGGPIESDYVPGFFVDESGQYVNFDSNKVPMGIGDTSRDRFVWMRGGYNASYMMVHNEIKPHQYFERGALSIEPHIDRYFGNVLLRKAGLWI